MNRIATPHLNVIALVKGTERYVWLYHDCDRDYEATLRCIGRFASNPELSLTWGDAAKLAQRLYEIIHMKGKE